MITIDAVTLGRLLDAYGFWRAMLNDNDPAGTELAAQRLFEVQEITGFWHVDRAMLHEIIQGARARRDLRRATELREVRNAG